MSRERNIVNRIKTNLEAINGSSGGYTFDLTGDDQVILGEEFNPARVPCAYVFVGTTETEQIAGRTILTQYDRIMKVFIVGFVNATSDAPGELMLRALDFQSDMMKCLESDRGLNDDSGSPLCNDLEVMGETYRGGELNLPSLGIAVIQVKVNYRQDAGTGT